MSGPTPLGALIAPSLTLPPVLAALPIRGVALDSRRIEPGFLFAALPAARPAPGAPGAVHPGHIADAVSRGAAAVLAPTGTPWPPGARRIPLIEVPDPRRLLGPIAAAHAGPQPERIAAITGTNGKTSTAEFLRQLWEGAGTRAASLGTLGLRADPDVLAAIGEAPPPLTTPDGVTLAVLLADLARAGVRAVALEASSHGLDQFRLDGVRVSAAGFSNLSQDHLDYHGTIERYRDAKLRLFAELLPPDGIAAANADMDPGTLDSLREICGRRGIPLRTAGENGATLRLLRAVPAPHGQVLTVSLSGRAPVEVPVSLPGRYQADNLLLALLLAAPDPDALAGMLPLLPALSGVRGRMELAARLPNGAAAFVDYAHTPDAIGRLLGSLRPHVAPGGRLLAVIGAGGDRDRSKRAPMGAAAARGADLVFVTDDNPRTEDPASIRAQVLAGCPDAVEIGDRRAAIAAALDALRPGDVLAVAGKGHEQGQLVGTAVLPFDDAAVLRALAGGRTEPTA